MKANRQRHESAFKAKVGLEALAEQLRRERTMPLRWIAERLGMGPPTRPAHQLYWKRRNEK